MIKIVFAVLLFSSLIGTAAATDVTECGWLNSTGTYNLTQNIVSNGTCLYIGAVNTVDLNGYIISHSALTAGSGILNSGFDGGIIRNGSIVSTNSTLSNTAGITIYTVTNTLIENVTILLNETGGVGINFQTNTNNNIIQNNYINTSKTGGGGGVGVIIGNSANNNTFTNNSVYAGSSAVRILQSSNGAQNNSFSGGILQGSYYTYEFSNTGNWFKNYFNTTGMGGTSRRVYLNNNASYFNYSNGSNIWVESRITNIGTGIFDRIIYNFSVSNITLSEQFTVANKNKEYNISGLSATTEYSIWNDSVNEINLTTDANGILPSFNVTFIDTSAHTVKILDATEDDSCTELTDTTISVNTTWNSTCYTMNGNISIDNGKVLTLDNVILQFNVSYNGTLSNIAIPGGTLILKNNSNITAINNNFWHMYVGYASDNRYPSLQVNDTLISRGNIYVHQTLKDGSSWMDNVTMTDWDPDVGAWGVTGAVSINTKACVDIRNSNFTDIDFSNQDYAIYNYFTGSGCSPNPMTFENNSFHDVTQVFPLSDSTGQSGIRILNNKIYNATPTYVIDFINGGDGSIISGNYLEHVAGAFVFNGGNDNISIIDNIVNNSDSVNSSNCLSLLGTSNITIRNHTCINTAYGINPSIMSAGAGNYINISESDVISIMAYGSGLGLYANNSLIYNNTFRANASTARGGINTHPSTPIKGLTINATFTNNTIISNGTGIEVKAAIDYIFIDNNITSVGTNIVMDINTTNIKFINNKYSSDTFSFVDNTSEFNNYYYGDINVTDTLGNPISGSTITFNQTVTTRNGSNISSVTTGADGHTPKPIGNDSTTLTLKNTSKTNTSQTNYSYQACASKSGYATNCTTITPDSLWYRPDPNTPTYTSTITLSEAAANTPPTAPTLTSNLNMSELNHNPTITFTKGTDADNDTVTTYIYVDATNPPTTQETFTTANNTTIGITTPLLDGITYYARARSWDGTNWSGYSDIDTFKMAGSAVPFAFSNTTLSETQIYQSSGVEDISVDINSSLGTISSATVTITYLSVDFIYTMTRGSGDTWTYSFKTSATGTYTVKEFNSTDSASNSDGDAWGATFMVVPVVSGGSSGATAPNITATPTPTPAGQNVTASIPLLSMSNPISELNKAIIKTVTIPENPTLKWMFVTFMTLFGVVLCVGVVLVKGQKVGKFSKPSALMIGIALIGLGLYLA